MTEKTCPFMEDAQINEKMDDGTVVYRTVYQTCLQSDCQMWDDKVCECKMGTSISRFHAQALVRYLVEEVDKSIKTSISAMVKAQNSIIPPPPMIHSVCSNCENIGTESCDFCPMFPLNYQPRNKNESESEDPPAPEDFEDPDDA